jgi:hypothetical protein
MIESTRVLRVFFKFDTFGICSVVVMHLQLPATP